MKNTSLLDVIDSFFYPIRNDDYQWPTMHVPKVDVLDSPEKYQIELEVPGYTKDEVSVVFDKGYLTIKGEKKQEKEDKKYLYRERSQQSFSRSFKLDSNIDVDKTNAKYENGILQIELIKKEKDGQKQIPIL